MSSVLLSPHDRGSQQGGERRELTAAREVLATIIASWKRGERVDARSALTAYPELRRYKSLMVNLAYEEYCLRSERGERLNTESFCGRFPECEYSLWRRLAIHNVLEPNLQWAEGGEWPEVGTIFFGYMLLEQLGQGAFSRVYLATEEALGGRLVALKLCELGGEEADTLGKLRHPHIVEVYSVRSVCEGRWTTICMPYLGRTTLDDVLREHRRQPLRRGADLRRLIRRRDGFWPPQAVRAGAGAWGERDGSAASDQSPTLPVAEAQPQAAEAELWWGSSAAGVSRAVGGWAVGGWAVGGWAVGGRGGRLTGSYTDSILEIAAGLADALDHAHSEGVVHMDLKPSNVLLTSDGTPRLLDFNLCLDQRQGRSRLGGTLPYMSPEQLRAVYFERGPAAELDWRSDIFSLAVIICELLSGQSPFGAPPEGCETSDPYRPEPNDSQEGSRRWESSDQDGPRAPDERRGEQPGSATAAGAVSAGSVEAPAAERTGGMEDRPAATGDARVAEETPENGASENGASENGASENGYMGEGQPRDSWRVEVPSQDEGLAVVRVGDHAGGLSASSRGPSGLEQGAASSGASEGASDSASEGASDGASEDARDGASEGASDSASEGASDGASEGARDGAIEGASDGASEGASDSASEGASDGTGWFAVWRGRGGLERAAWLQARHEAGPEGVDAARLGVSRRCAAFLRRCLSHDPRSRPTAYEAALLLRREAGWRGRWQRWLAARRGWCAALALILCACLTGGLLHLALRPAYPERQRAAAERQLAAGQPALALPHLQRALEARPKDPQLLLLRGRTYAQLEDYPSAIRDLREVVELTDHPKAMAILGYYCGKYRLHHDAIGWNALAIDRGETTAVVWNNLGYSYYQRRNLAQAEKAFRQAISIDPFYSRSLRSLALVEFAKARQRNEFPREAISLIQRAIEHNGESFEDYRTAAWIVAYASQFEADRETEAVRHLKSAIETGLSIELARSDSAFEALWPLMENASLTQPIKPNRSTNSCNDFLADPIAGEQVYPIILRK